MAGQVPYNEVTRRQADEVSRTAAARSASAVSLIDDHSSAFAHPRRLREVVRPASRRVGRREARRRP